MIKLVNQYKLEFATAPFEPEDGKVYFVSTEINPAADRFVEDNLEELREAFAGEGLEFVFVRGKIGKDVNGHDVPPTVLSFVASETTDKGIAFKAYHIDLEKDKTGEALLYQLLDVARVYSIKDQVKYSIQYLLPKTMQSIPDYDDPEIIKNIEEFKRSAQALRMKGVKPWTLKDMFTSISLPLELTVDMNGNLVIFDFCGIVVKLNPIEKALYLLLLQHPEGIEPDALVGHRKELLRIYRHFTIYEDEKDIETSIDNLLSEDKGALYTHISRLNKRFDKMVGSDFSKPYKVQFRRKPEPGRYLIDIPFDNIRWEQRF